MSDASPMDKDSMSLSGLSLIQSKIVSTFKLLHLSLSLCRNQQEKINLTHHLLVSIKQIIS